MRITPVILAGGIGSRLWPLSRATRPKQFLKFFNDISLFQSTLSRLEHLKCNKPIVVCNTEHRFLVAEQLRELNQEATIILEPISKNTAPAIALAAFNTIEKCDEHVLLILPADHFIEDHHSFCNSVESALTLVQQNKLVTFGVVARWPETGFGYIKAGCELVNGYMVEDFKEKPDLEMASKYVASGEYYWNSGMFLFKASSFLDELNQLDAEIYDCCKRSYENRDNDIDFLRVAEDFLVDCPSVSIDYAVMEKTNSAAVVPLDAGWSDIGSWSAICEFYEKDQCDNIVLGDAILENSTNCLVMGEDRLISVLGMDDVVIVDTRDAILIANRTQIQNVKSIVEKLKMSRREEWKIHREVFRPWGKYDLIDIGSRYKVKRISVKPGAQLSVQLHNQRAEHWVILSGIANVTVGNKTFSLSRNESTYIPIGTIHALENPGEEPLELIEVQTGSHLSEDDIVRIEDSYGRC